MAHGEKKVLFSVAIRAKLGPLWIRGGLCDYLSEAASWGNKVEIDPMLEIGFLRRSGNFRNSPAQISYLMPKIFFRRGFLYCE